MSLAGKVAFVTGASRGIGRGIAKALAMAGADVALLARTVDGAQAAADDVRAAGRKALAMPGDVSATAEVDVAIAKTLEVLGRLDILVNNAGVTADGLLVRMKDEDFDRVLAVNLRGTFLTTRAAIRPMMKARSGRIINISSVVGLHGNAGQANYAASKAGVIGFTKSVAREVASRGITANVICPGWITTDMTSGLPEAVKTGALASIPLGRFGEPADIAQAVTFLAGDGASYITGAVLQVDGGMSL